MCGLQQQYPLNCTKGNNMVTVIVNAALMGANGSSARKPTH